MDETDRRREAQLAFNKKHDITPKGIKKGVADVMEVGSSGDAKRRAKWAPGAAAPVGNKRGNSKIASLSPTETAKAIRKLEKQMYDAAHNLEFEKAAEFRDQLELFRENVFKPADIS